MKLYPFLSFLILSLTLSFLSLASVESPDLKSYHIEKPQDWTPLILKKISPLKVALKAPSQRSTLTIREFNNIKEKSLKKNVATWLSDYRSYGFTISEKKPLKLNSNTYGFLIEALHKNSGKIFKQFMSITDGQLITVTCHSDRIDEEFKACSESLKSFSW